MGATAAAVFEFFSADAAAAATADAFAAEATSVAAAGAGAFDVAAAAGATATADAALTAGAAGLAGAAGGILKEGGSALLGSSVAGLLAPKPQMPQQRPPTPMPDPFAQAEAKKRSLAEQVTRSGRASTILTASDSGKLGG